MGDLDALRPMLERILREEVRQALRKERRHRVVEIFVDPASGQLSCSRVGMAVVVMVLFPASLALQAVGVELGQAWSSLVALAGTLAGIYGLNSAARVWRNGGRVNDSTAGQE